MQANYGPAISHVRSGGKILYEMQKTKLHHHPVLEATTTPYVPMERLEHLFKRLELQVSQMIGEPDWILDRMSAKLHQGKDMPPVFTTLSEARDSLIDFWQSTATHWTTLKNSFGTTGNLSPISAVWRDECTPMLDQWSTNFTAFLDHHGNALSKNEKMLASALQIHIHYLSVSLQVGIDNEAGW